MNRAAKAAYNAVYYRANRERIAAQGRIYRAANAEKIAAKRAAVRPLRNAQSLAWYHNNRARARENHLIYSYGLTSEMVAEYLDCQEGACAFCGRELPPLGSKNIAIDHDHEMGRFRGIVHMQCNSVIALAETDDRFVGYIAASRWAVA